MSKKRLGAICSYTDTKKNSNASGNCWCHAEGVVQRDNYRLPDEHCSDNKVVDSPTGRTVNNWNSMNSKHPAVELTTTKYTPLQYCVTTTRGNTLSLERIEQPPNISDEMTPKSEVVTTSLPKPQMSHLHSELIWCSQSDCRTCMFSQCLCFWNFLTGTNVYGASNNHSIKFTCRDAEKPFGRLSLF